MAGCESVGFGGPVIDPQACLETFDHPAMGYAGSPGNVIEAAAAGTIGFVWSLWQTRPHEQPTTAPQPDHPSTTEQERDGNASVPTEKNDLIEWGRWLFGLEPAEVPHPAIASPGPDRPETPSKPHAEPQTDEHAAVASHGEAASQAETTSAEQSAHDESFADLDGEPATANDNGATDYEWRRGCPATADAYAQAQTTANDAAEASREASQALKAAQDAANSSNEADAILHVQAAAKRAEDAANRAKDAAESARQAAGEVERLDEPVPSDVRTQANSNSQRASNNATDAAVDAEKARKLATEYLAASTASRAAEEARRTTAQALQELSATYHAENPQQAREAAERVETLSRRTSTAAQLADNATAMLPPQSGSPSSLRLNAERSAAAAKQSARQTEQMSQSAQRHLSFLQALQPNR